MVMDPNRESDADGSLALIDSARDAANELTSALAGTALPHDALPGYRIVREIHRGGQGVVYRAVRLATGRDVAVKVLRDGPFGGPREMERFEREVRVLAQLSHPNIVGIHDRGAAGGCHYFVMDYVAGQTLDAYINERRPSLSQRLELFLKICHAVNAAHLRGVIHRDLKPSNVRIDESGEPHVLDFGLAKLTAEMDQSTRNPTMTITGQFVGSLPWASPEQADGSPDACDLRSDVYSLGVVLYQMLTGAFPYSVVGKVRDVLRNVTEAEPRPPRSLTREVDDEIQTIVLKCLSKEPERRYQSAGELARDIRRYLGNEPIEAKRDSTLYVLRKQMHRYRAPLLVIAGFVVVLIASSIIGWSLYLQSQERLRDSYLAQAHATRVGDKPGRRFNALDALTKATAIRPSIELRNEAIAAIALTDVQIVKEAPTELSRTGGVVFNDAGDRYCFFDTSVSTTGRVVVHRVSDNQAVLTVAGPLQGRDPRFSHDGRLLACASTSGCDIWEIERGLLVRQISTGATYRGQSLAFSPDDRELAVGEEDGSVSIHTMSSDGHRVLPPVNTPVQLIRYHPKENVLATGCYRSGDVFIRDAETGEVLHTLHYPGDGIWDIAWSPNGAQLASSSGDLTVYVSEARTGRVQFTVKEHMNVVHRVHFDSTGSLLLTSAWDGTTRITDARTGFPLLVVPETAADHFHTDSSKFGFLRNSSVVTVGVAEVARSNVFHSLIGEALDAIVDSSGWVRPSADGRFIALTSWTGVRISEVAKGQQIAFLPSGRTHSVLFHPDGTDVITAGNAGVLRWPVATESGRIRIGPPQTMYPPSGDVFYESCISSDGRTLFVASRQLQHEVLVFNLDRPGEPRRIGPHPFIRYLALSPDDKLLATGTWKGEGVKIWNVETGDLVCELPIDRNASVDFSPDGLWLVTSEAEHIVWRTSTWRAEARFPRHNYNDVPGPIAISPDSTILAVVDSAPPFKLMLVDLTRTEQIAVLEFPENLTSPESLVFSPDGTRLIFPNPQKGHILYFWDLRAMREQLAAMDLDWDLPPYAPVPAKDLRTPLHVEVDLGEFALHE